MVREIKEKWEKGKCGYVPFKGLKVEDILYSGDGISRIIPAERCVFYDIILIHLAERGYLEIIAREARRANSHEIRKIESLLKRTYGI